MDVHLKTTKFRVDEKEYKKSPYLTNILESDISDKKLSFEDAFMYTLLSIKPYTIDMLIAYMGINKSHIIQQLNDIKKHITYDYAIHEIEQLPNDIKMICYEKWIQTHDITDYSNIHLNNWPKIYVICKYQIELNLDVNICDKRGTTTLIWCCYKECWALVKDLLNIPNININIENKSYHTALLLVCMKKNEDIALLMLNKNIQYDKATLEQAKLNDMDMVVKKMIELKDSQSKCN